MGSQWNATASLPPTVRLIPVDLPYLFDIDSKLVNDSFAVIFASRTFVKEGMIRDSGLRLGLNRYWYVKNRVFG